MNRRAVALPGMDYVESLLRAELLDWVRENPAGVPNLDRLYKKMATKGAGAHYVHAHYAKKLHDCGRYRISDIEATADGHDVDIQLDGRINIQIWHGMNTHGHIMVSRLDPGTPRSDAVGRHLGFPTMLGGVPTDPEGDEKKILKKLAQLPDDALGILLLHGSRTKYWVPLCPERIPANKCILNIIDRGIAELRCSPAFSHIEEIDNVAGCMGIYVVPAS